MAKQKQKKKVVKLFFKTNRQIRASEVRLVGDVDNSGDVVTIQEALRQANDMGVDLVEISPKANPPVCKLVDYNKHLYELKRKQKDAEKKQKENAQDIKELRFGPNTDEHDFNFKLKHAEEFLKRGDIVKAFVFFKGREITFKEKGELLLLKLADALSEFGLADSAKPKLEGRRMIMFIRPKKK